MKKLKKNLAMFATIQLWIFYIPMFYFSLYMGVKHNITLSEKDTDGWNMYLFYLQYALLSVISSDYICHMTGWLMKNKLEQNSQPKLRIYPDTAWKDWEKQTSVRIASFQVKILI